jgi:hypothetical protein
MAITGVVRSYDNNAISNREDLVDIISSISPTETPLFTMLNRGNRATNTKHEWLEDALRGMSTHLTAAVTVAQTSIRVAAGDRLPCSTNYPVLVRIGEELILANARTTNFINNITRGYNSTTTSAHSSSATVEIIADLDGEGSDARQAFSQTKSRPYNYTQAFRQTISVSGSQQAIVQAGVVGSEADYQIAQRFKELAILVERSLITGTRVVNSSTVTYRSLGGLWTFITTNKTNASSASVTETNIMDDAKSCYDAGGRPSVLLCNSTQMQRIVKLYDNRIRTEPEEIFGGTHISRILCPWTADGTLSLILDPWVPQHEYYILDMAKLALVPFRDFQVYPLAKTGDAENFEVVGEYTLEVRNQTAHARRYGLATT